MLVVVLNGPINAGKTTTGQAMAAMLPDALFIDGDDHDAPDGAPLAVRIAAAFDRLDHLIAAAQTAVLIIAVPLRNADFERVQNACRARAANLLVVTLAPPLEIALSNRGTRQLTTGEVTRSRQMYAEGYASRAFSNLVISDMSTAQATAEQICRRLGLCEQP